MEKERSKRYLKAGWTGRALTESLLFWRIPTQTVRRDCIHLEESTYSIFHRGEHFRNSCVHSELAAGKTVFQNLLDVQVLFLLHPCKIFANSTQTSSFFSRPFLKFDTALSNGVCVLRYSFLPQWEWISLLTPRTKQIPFCIPRRRKKRSSAKRTRSKPLRLEFRQLRSRQFSTSVWRDR